jgi:3-methyladenine DNA glycosylase AlkC
MDILTRSIKENINSEIIDTALRKEYGKTMRAIPNLIDRLNANIPRVKRQRFGRVYTVKALSAFLYTQLLRRKARIFAIATYIFRHGDTYKTKGTGLGLLAEYGMDHLNRVKPYFEAAAADNDWNVRELAQMFFRKLISTHPDETYIFLQQLVRSDNPQVRRFVSETLRPVQENHWFHSKPDYPLTILQQLFTESSPYPRTSVGNNLSDLARRLPGLVYNIINELVESGDKNSYWIAYRACRNLVKKDPIKVMDLLHVDEYRYKKQVFLRRDYQRS